MHSYFVRDNPREPMIISLAREEVAKLQRDLAKSAGVLSYSKRVIVQILYRFKDGEIGDDNKTNRRDIRSRKENNHLQIEEVVVWIY